MPLTSLTRIEPGDQATAASLTNRLTNMQSAVNALPLNAVEQDSLTRQHLPTVIIGTPGTVALNLSAELAYDGRAGNEPYPGWNTVAGWRPVNDVGGAAIGAVGNVLQVTSLNVSLATTRTIEVRAECEVVTIRPWDFAAGSAYSTVGPWRSFAVFALQYSNDGATWYHVPLSERYLDAESDNDSAYTGAGAVADEQTNKRLKIRALIKSTDAGGAITVNYVRLVVSCWQSANASSWAAAAPNAPNVRTRVYLRKCNLHAYGFQHGTLS